MIKYASDDVFVRFNGVAFSKEGVRKHKAMVENGDILVFDEIAGYYVKFHSLSKNAEKKIRKAEMLIRKNQLNQGYSESFAPEVDYVIEGWR